MKKRLAHGGYATLATLIALSLLVLLALSLDALDACAYLRLDLSPDSLSDLGEQTRLTLETLSEDIHFYTIYKTGTATSLRALQEETLARYIALSPHILVENIDPALEPHRVAALNPSGEAVGEGAVFVANSGGTRVLRVREGDFLYNRTLEGKVYALFCGETRFTGAILNLTSADIPRVQCLTGHGETPRAAISTVEMQLRALGFEVDEADLNNGAPQAGTALFVLAPKTDLTDAEVHTLKAWLDAGGRMLIAYGADTPQEKLQNFATLLDLYGLGFESGYVVESASRPDAFVDLPERVKPGVLPHPITENLTERLILPAACAVRVPDPRPGVETESLLLSSDRAYRKTDIAGNLHVFEPEDVSGRQTLALAATGAGGMRVVQLASVSMLMDESETTGGNLLNASANLEWVAACAQWLLGREEIIASADLKVIPTNLVTFASEREKQLVSYAIVCAIPGVILLIGCAVTLKRRRR